MLSNLATLPLPRVTPTGLPLWLAGSSYRPELPPDQTIRKSSVPSSNDPVEIRPIILFCSIPLRQFRNRQRPTSRRPRYPKSCGGHLVEGASLAVIGCFRILDFAARRSRDRSRKTDIAQYVQCFRLHGRANLRLRISLTSWPERNRDLAEREIKRFPAVIEDDMN